MTPEGPVTINVRSVIAAKSASLERLLPAFVIRIMERTVHERDLNRILGELRGHRGLEFLGGALELFGVNIVVHGVDQLRRAGNPLVVANHPLGGMDGMALMLVVGRTAGAVYVPANDLLMNVEPLRDFFVPVNKHGSNVEHRDRFEQAFSSDRVIVHFPAGLCSRKRAGRVRDLRWQKSFVVRARRYRRDIVPVHIDGENSPRFYNLARLRRWFGVGFNVEMVFLVDEMFRQKGRTLTLTIGAPIPWETLDRRHNDWDWARLLRRHIYALAAEPSARFIG